MKQLAWITNAAPDTGVGHYAAALEPLMAERAQAAGLSLQSYVLDGGQRQVLKERRVITQLSPWPGVLNQKSVTWLRMGKPLHVQLRDNNTALVHLTNQTLSFLIDAVRPYVLTVHDILERTRSQSTGGALAARLLYRNMASAAHLVCVSNFTAEQVREYLGRATPPITVIPNGVSSDFHPIDHFTQTIGSATLRQELKLAPDDIVVLYVGSEHPRKDLTTALRAFARCRETLPRLVFLKVGSPGLSAGREATLKIIEELALRDHIRFLPSVSLARLNELYNVADVFVYPSTYEGFGLPPLQAMAAGTPVIAVNSTSLPEVVGDAGLLVPPSDVDAFAGAILEIVQNKQRAAELRQRGIARAQQFTWERAAQDIVDVYISLHV